MFQFKQPVAQFFDLDGAPLDAGYVYLGTVGANPEVAANQVTVYWDVAGTIPAAQPLRTVGGHIARNGKPAAIYTNEAGVSLVIRDSLSRLVYSDITGTQLTADQVPLYFKTKAAAVAYIDTNGVANGQKYSITSSDGGEFVGITGAAPGTYVADSTNGCGTVILPTGGDGSSAIKRTFDGTVSIAWYNPALDGTDDSTEINEALSAGYTIVDGLDTPAGIASSVTIPANTTFRNANLLSLTSGMNMVLVNTRSKLFGKLTGSGDAGVVERGVYPAADSVDDVELNLEVTNLTFGVHATPLVSGVDANIPRRWYGFVNAHDIIGTAGSSLGYGALLSPAKDCHLTILANNVARHALYLSAGAADNIADVIVDGCSNYAVNIFSTGAQPTTQRNTVRIKAKNLTENVAGNSGAVSITQNANYNTVIVDVEGDGNSRYMANVEGASGGPYPYGNKVIDGSATGSFTGSEAIRLQNADSTRIEGNTLHCYGTFGVVSSRTSGTNGSTHGGFIEHNDIDPQGQNRVGVFVGMTAQPVHVGINDIRNTGTSLRVYDNTSGTGYRTGYSRRTSISGTTASIGPGASGDTVATLTHAIQIANRVSNVVLNGASVSLANTPFWTGVLNPAAETQINFRTYNGSGAAQTFNYTAVVEGD